MMTGRFTVYECEISSVFAASVTVLCGSRVFSQIQKEGGGELVKWSFPTLSQ